MAELSRDQLQPALLAQAQLCGADEPPGEAMPRALRWLRAAWEAGEDHLPLLLVHDLGHLLLRGHDFRFVSGRRLDAWSGPRRSLRLRYEDQVLGTWSLDPGVRQLHVAVAGMPTALQDAAIQHALVLALARPLRGLSGLLRGNPAHLRSCWTQLNHALAHLDVGADPGEPRSSDPGEPAPDTPDPDGVSGDDALPEAWSDWADALLQSLVAHLGPERLFTEEDLWEVEHLEQLPSDSARLALRELHASARRIGHLPTGAVLTVRQAARQIPVDVEEAGSYPTGGFDAISTQGRFENLVRTEISYVGEGSGHGGLDLFDLRYIEGELLYYTRDQSPLLDSVRTLSVVFDRPSELRTKHRQLAAQTLVLVQSLALILQSDLIGTFGPAGVRIRFAWWVHDPDDEQVADEELRLLSHSLAAELAHDRIVLEALPGLETIGPRGRVVFSPRAAPAQPEGLWCRVGQPQWSCRAGEEAWSVDATDRGALRELATRILLEHLG